MEFWDQNDSGICRVSEKLEWWNLCVNWRPVRWVDVVWGYLKWKLNPQDAISRERKTWPGRLRRNGQHLLQHHRPGTPGDGSCISRRPRLTRSLEDARYVHINFRLLADLVEFERVKKIYAFIFFITGVCIFPWWIFWSPVVAQCHFNANYLVLPIQSTEYFSQPFQYLN